jgi:hypothetical protein
VALNTKNQSIKSNIATKGNVNDQFSSFLDRKQTNYLPNAKGKTKLLLCKNQKKRLSKKKMYLSYLEETKQKT